ncbi:neuromedin-B receptor isoform 6-T6 [Syngnathus typhle]
MADEFLSQLEAGNSSDDGAGGEVSSDGAYAAVRGVMTSAYTLIVLVGVLGNVTLVKIFVSTSAMRSVPNIFISSLAAGDLLLLVTCVPVDALRFFSEEWILGEVACKLLPAVQLTSVGVSVFTLTALSADRYKAIVKPMDIQASGAVLRTCAKAAAIWLLSVLLAVPEAIFSQVVSMQGQRGPENASFLNCVPYPLSEQTHPKVHAVMLFLVYFLFPLSIISVYYYHIARTLVRSARDMPGEVSEHTKKQLLVILRQPLRTLPAERQLPTTLQQSAALRGRGRGRRSGASRPSGQLPVQHVPRPSDLRQKGRAHRRHRQQAGSVTGERDEVT